MQDFLDKKSDILVATSVVEVGVNVPNATVIIIEHADRFGLAQLHQLRGRVGRAEHQSYCYLFTESFGETTFNRLKGLVKAKNGFELAEQDMLTLALELLVTPNNGESVISRWRRLRIPSLSKLHVPRHASLSKQTPFLLIIKNFSESLPKRKRCIWSKRQMLDFR